MAVTANAAKLISVFALPAFHTFLLCVIAFNLSSLASQTPEDSGTFVFLQDIATIDD